MSLNKPAQRGTVRGYGAGSKRQTIIQYFRENPDARPVVVAERFGYAYSATWECKKVARRTMQGGAQTAMPNLKPASGALGVIPTETLQGIIDGLYPSIVPETQPAELTEPVDLWRGFGEWMPREQLIGYLRGLVIDKMARPLASHKDMREASRAAAKLAELMGG
jgi:hypothetical protein